MREVKGEFTLYDVTFSDLCYTDKSMVIKEIIKQTPNPGGFIVNLFHEDFAVSGCFQFSKSSLGDKWFEKLQEIADRLNIEKYGNKNI